MDRLRRALGALTSERGQSIANRACIAALIVVGALDAWFTRKWNVNPDGVSYIDMARAFDAHGFAGLINGYWSPLYPATIGVAIKVFSPDRDLLYPMVRAVNWAVFVVTTFAFARLLKVTMTRHLALHDSPGWAIALFLTAAWGLFYLLVSQAVGQGLVTPDMGVAAVVFFVASELLELRDGPWAAGRWARLGAVLALGYWWKAILFPVGGVALLIAAWIAWRRRDQVRGPLSGAVVFGALALALAIPVSAHVGRATFGETGRLNHLWFVSNVPMIATTCISPGGRLPSPEVPTGRVLLAHPLTCHTGEAADEVTLPLWYNPTPYYSAVRNHLSAAEIAVAIRNNVEYMRVAFLEWFAWPGVALAIALLAVIAMRAFASASWPLLAFGALPIAAYLSVYVELRHIVPFIVCIALATLAALAGRNATWSRAILALVATVIAAQSAVRLARQQRVEAAILVRELRRLSRPEQEAITVARGLAERGLVPGDRVATINTMWNVEWAQRAGLVVRAWIPEYTYAVDAAYAELSAPCTRAAFLDALRTERIRAVVLRDIPLPAPAWFEQIGNTAYRVHVLGPAEQPPEGCAPAATRSSSGTAAR